jgi:hypothetical protein
MVMKMLQDIEGDDESGEKYAESYDNDDHSCHIYSIYIYILSHLQL